MWKLLSWPNTIATAPPSLSLSFPYRLSFSSYIGVFSLSSPSFRFFFFFLSLQLLKILARTLLFLHPHYSIITAATVNPLSRSSHYKPESRPWLDSHRLPQPSDCWCLLHCNFSPLSNFTHNQQLFPSAQHFYRALIPRPPIMPRRGVQAYGLDMERAYVHALYSSV